MNEVNQELFEIRIPRSTFNNLKTAHQFQHIVRFARYVNQLSFCFAASKDLPPNFDDFRVTRQILNSYMFTVAILHEALKAFDNMYGLFGGMKAYTSGTEAIKAHPSYDRIRGILSHGRDRVTFHVDVCVYKHELKVTTPDHFEVFVKGFEDGQITHLYFPLADELAFDYLFGFQDKDNDATVDEKSRLVLDAIDQMNDFVILFLKHANSLLYDYCSEKDWEVIKLNQRN